MPTSDPSSSIRPLKLLSDDGKAKYPRTGLGRHDDEPKYIIRGLLRGNAPASLGIGRAVRVEYLRRRQHCSQPFDLLRDVGSDNLLKAVAEIEKQETSCQTAGELHELAGDITDLKTGDELRRGGEWSIGQAG